MCALNSVVVVVVVVDFAFRETHWNDGNVKVGLNVLFKTKQNAKVVKLMSREGRTQNCCQVLCVCAPAYGKGRKEREERKISVISKKGECREKSRRHSATFTLITSYVAGKT